MAGKDVYSRLMRSRSKQTFKDLDKNMSSPKSSANNPAKSSKPGLKSDSMLSLPLSMTGTDSSSLRDDEGISQFLSNENQNSPTILKDSPQRPLTVKNANDDGLETPRSGSPKPSAAGLRSPTSTMNSPIDGSHLSRRSAESVVGDLRENVLREMKEKEVLLSKYEALSRQHTQLEDRLARKPAEAPKQQDLSQNEDYKRLLSKHEALSAQNRELQEQLAKKEEEIRATGQANDQDPSRSTEDPKHMEDQLSNARGLIKSHEQENERLRRHNHELQQGIPVPNRVDGVTTDGDLKGEMGKLALDIQSWILNNFRKYKLDLSNLDEETEQQVEVLAVPRWKAVAGIAKIPFLQALASTAVIEVFYDEFFIGLPSSTKYSTLRSAFQFFQSQSPSFSRWRSATVAFLSNLDDPEITKSTKKLAATLSQGIDHLLCQVTEAEISEDRQQSLQEIVAGAIRLARRFRSQRADYEFNFPRNSPDRALAFNSSTMEDIRAEEDDSKKKTVQLATFPAVLKTRDEDGTQQKLGNVVIKARVLCGAKIGT